MVEKASKQASQTLTGKVNGLGSYTESFCSWTPSHTGIFPFVDLDGEERGYAA